MAVSNALLSVTCPTVEALRLKRLFRNMSHAPVAGSLATAYWQDLIANQRSHQTAEPECRAVRPESVVARAFGPAWLPLGTLRGQYHHEHGRTTVISSCVAVMIRTAICPYRVGFGNGAEVRDNVAAHKLGEMWRLSRS